jgi:hypothetical protein
MKSVIKIVGVMLCMLSVSFGKELQVKVVDENGLPIDGADVMVHYVGGPSETRNNGKTNKNGIFVSRGEVPYYRVELEINKEGYYMSQFRHQKDNPLPKDAEGEFQLALRKIGDPVAMYAKKVNMIFPSLDKEYGFDFEAGDSVKPHGIGTRDDVMFSAQKTFKDLFTYKGIVVVSFPQEKDGLLVDHTHIPGSVYLSAKQAPIEEPYKRITKIIRGRPIDKNQPNTPMYNYVFRVRSKVNGKDFLETANYGEIVGGMLVAAASNEPEAIAIRFAYYYNPTPNNTSLEFFRKKNLFKNLKQMEHVAHP